MIYESENFVWTVLEKPRDLDMSCISEGVRRIRADSRLQIARAHLSVKLNPTIAIHPSAKNMFTQEVVLVLPKSRAEELYRIGYLSVGRAVSPEFGAMDK